LKDESDDFWRGLITFGVVKETKINPPAHAITSSTTLDLPAGASLEFLANQSMVFQDLVCYFIYVADSGFYLYFLSAWLWRS
jgi:hypothetical protein